MNQPSRGSTRVHPAGDILEEVTEEAQRLIELVELAGNEQLPDSHIDALSQVIWL